MAAKALLLGTLASALTVLALSCGSEKTSEPDTTPPATIADLQVTSTGCDNVSLAWTAPGDDGTEGKAASYDLRYLDEGISETNWESATQCQNEPAPKAAGQTENLTVAGLTSGTTYHFALIASDDEDNDSGISNDASTSVGSPAIAWVNDGLSTDEDWSASATSLSANWAAAACADDYEYAIGTTAGGTDVIGWTSRGSQTSITRTGLTLADGETYYFSVRGVLGIVPGTLTSSDGITVDVTAPASEIGALADTVATPVFTVSWSGGDAGSGIKQYDIQVSSDGGSSWGNWLVATALTSGDFTGINGRTYHFRSRAYDNAGNIEAYPPTPDAHTTVHLSTLIGWVRDGLGEDEDWVASATTLSANWAAAGFADSYDYALGTVEGATDVVGWTSTGTATSVTRSGLTLSDGHIYYFSVRSVYGGSPAAPTSSDGITVDVTAPASQVNPLPDEVPSMTFDLAWGGSDATSGVESYDIQVSENGGGSWYTWLTGTTLTSGSFPGAPDITYHFRSRAHDNAGNTEAYPATSDAHTTVNLAANKQVVYVNDGLGDDVDWTSSWSTLSANWPGVSGVEAYESAVGTTPGGVDVSGWGWAGDGNEVSITPLSLLNGETYYVSIRAVVGAGRGPGVSSDGITVDWDPPASSVDSLAAATGSAPFTVTWSGSDALSGVASYDIQIKDGDGPWQDWVTVTSATSQEAIGETDHIYYFRSRACDLAGNLETYPDEADASIRVTCTFAYSLHWGQEGTGPGDFKYPFNVAVDAIGNVYVAESDNSRIQVFDASGGLLDTWGGAGGGDGEFRHAVGVAVDDSGYVYVTDFNNDRVQKFNPDGSFVTKWGTSGTGENELVYPRGITVDDSFYVYVAEQGNERIHKFTSNGVSVAIWGGVGTEDGKFRGLMSVAVGPSGNIYAVDSYNSRIQEFTPNGTFVRKWGTFGGGDGEFASISFIAVDASGYVYVTQGVNCLVQRFTPDGKFLNKWGGCGPEEGQFLDEPFGIAVDAQGAVYVTDLMAGRVVKFLPTCP